MSGNNGAMDQGKIIYTLISRDVTVLAEFADATGNFTQISRDVINRIDAYTSRKMRCAYNVLYSYSSYAYNDTIHFHIMVEAGLIFLCMADASFVKRRAYAFLIDIRNLFIQKFGSSWQSAIAYAMNAQFSRILADRANFFSTDPNSDKLLAIQHELDAAKTVLTESIDKLIDRGEHIDLLVDKTARLEEDTYSMKKKSGSLRKKLWWRNMRIWCCVCVVLIIIVVILVAVLVTTQKNAT